MKKLLDDFLMEICCSRNVEETAIIAKYENMVSLIFYIHIGIAQLTGLAFLFLPLLSIAGGKDETYFPLKLIGSIENPVYYWLTYVFQVVATIISIFVHVTLDTMLAGFILLTCGQIDLCRYRFISSNIDEIQQSTKECVIHQLLIRRIVQKLEKLFMSIAMPLVLLNLITLCASIYNISQTKIGNAELFSIFMYLGTLLCQLFGYCWFGNELKLKSTAICETMYNSDWTTLKPFDRKSLYFIMLSCQKETEISFYGFCTFSMDIFVWVLKTSYAAYNLLKTIEAT